MICGVVHRTSPSSSCVTWLPSVWWRSVQGSTSSAPRRCVRKTWRCLSQRLTMRTWPSVFRPWRRCTVISAVSRMWCVLVRRRSGRTWYWWGLMMEILSGNGTVFVLCCVFCYLILKFFCYLWHYNNTRTVIIVIIVMTTAAADAVCLVWAQECCRIRPRRFLAECCKKTTRPG